MRLLRVPGKLGALMSHSEILAEIAEARAEARAVAEELAQLCDDLQRKLDKQQS